MSGVVDSSSAHRVFRQIRSRIHQLTRAMPGVGTCILRISTPMEVAVNLEKLTAVIAVILCSAASSQEPNPVEEGSSNAKQVETLKAGFERLEVEIRSLARSEPTLCFRLLSISSDITVGQAVELCGGTTDALKTLACYEEAFRHPDENGLGL